MNFKWVGILLLSALLAAPQVLANGGSAVRSPIPVKAMSFEQVETRLRTASALGQRGNARALESLVERLQVPEEEPRMRSANYEALGRHGGP